MNLLCICNHNRPYAPTGAGRIDDVVTWAQGQLMINFMCIFKVFTILPNLQSGKGNLENFGNGRSQKISIPIRTAFRISKGEGGGGGSRLWNSEGKGVFTIGNPKAWGDFTG